MKHRNFLQPGITHKLTVSGGEDDQELSSSVQIFRIAVTADMYMVLNGTADNSGILIVAEHPEYFVCPPGSSVSVFGTGDAHITEMQ